MNNVVENIILAINANRRIYLYHVAYLNLPRKRIIHFLNLPSVVGSISISIFPDWLRIYLCYTHIT